MSSEEGSDSDFDVSSRCSSRTSARCREGYFYKHWGGGGVGVSDAVLCHYTDTKIKSLFFFLSLEAAAATTMSLARASLQQIGIWKCRPSENVGPRKRTSFGKVREEVQVESVEKQK